MTITNINNTTTVNGNTFHTIGEVITNGSSEHCPTCNEWKESIEFNKQSSSWDNLARMCRKCLTEYRENMRKNKNVLEKLKYIVNLRNDEEWNVLGKIR